MELKSTAAKIQRKVAPFQKKKEKKKTPQCQLRLGSQNPQIKEPC